MKDDFFINKMKGVKPIEKKDDFFKKNNKRKLYNVKKDISVKESDLTTVKKIANIKKSEFNISFSEINKDLKKGRVKIDKKIDLHGFSLIEAEGMFRNSIIKCYNNNMRCILFITGKGVNKKTTDDINEDQKPKLFYGKIKNHITSWINDNSLNKYILTYQNAGIEHGGEGAIFIYLRKNKN